MIASALLTVFFAVATSSSALVTVLQSGDWDCELLDTIARIEASRVAECLEQGQVYRSFFEAGGYQEAVDRLGTVPTYDVFEDLPTP